MKYLAQTCGIKDMNETLVDLLQMRAATNAVQTAYTFLRDGDGVAMELSYAQLDRRARAIAVRLQDLRLQGQRAVLLYPPGLDYIAAFFGCLYAGTVAVPAYAPSLNTRRGESEFQRIRIIAEDAKAAAVLTTGEVLSRLDRATLEKERGHWVTTDTIAVDASSDWHRPALGGNTLAFLQYTSGSTTMPRGVMLSHAALLTNLAQIQRNFRISTDSCGVIWLPPYHDMGLIGGILEPVYSAIPVTLMTPVTAVQRPLLWLRAISEQRGVISGGPNFAFDLCVNKITPEQRDSLDLSGWEIAFSGAEPVRAQTLHRFAEYFASCGFRKEAFYPCYGLAEATLFVTGSAAESPPRVGRFSQSTLEKGIAARPTGDETERALVSCGRADRDTRIVIVDPERYTPVPDGTVGEIWVKGPSVAMGYWNRPEDTQAVFQAILANGEGPLLRTGDLGFVLDEELYVTGRLKDVILIRGRNHYPQDIELTVERSHPALRPNCGAAFAIEQEGEECLVVVHEIHPRGTDAPAEDIVAAIRRAVSDQHQLQASTVVLLKAGTIPKTSSGKIQRRKCRARFITRELHQVYPDQFRQAVGG